MDAGGNFALQIMKHVATDRSAFPSNSWAFVPSRHPATSLMKPKQR